MKNERNKKAMAVARLTTREVAALRDDSLMVWNVSNKIDNSKYRERSIHHDITHERSSNDETTSARKTNHWKERKSQLQERGYGGESPFRRFLTKRFQCTTAATMESNETPMTRYRNSTSASGSSNSSSSSNNGSYKNSRKSVVEQENDDPGDNSGNASFHNGWKLQCNTTRLTRCLRISSNRTTFSGVLRPQPMCSKKILVVCIIVFWAAIIYPQSVHAKVRTTTPRRNLI